MTRAVTCVMSRVTTRVIDDARHVGTIRLATKFCHPLSKTNIYLTKHEQNNTKLIIKIFSIRFDHFLPLFFKSVDATAVPFSVLGSEEFGKRFAHFFDSFELFSSQPVLQRPKKIEITWRHVWAVRCVIQRLPSEFFNLLTCLN